MLRKRLFVDLAAGQHAQVYLLSEKAEKQGSQRSSHIFEGQGARPSFNKGPLKLAFLLKDYETLQVYPIYVFLVPLLDFSHDSVVLLDRFRMSFEEGTDGVLGFL